MSQMNEESEKRDLRVQEIEENLTNIKNCAEYLQGRYENIKQIYDEIIIKDKDSESYQSGIQAILKLTKSTYKKTKKKLENLHINVSKESEPLTIGKLLTNSDTNDSSTINSEINVNSSETNSDKVATGPSINQEDNGATLSGETLQCNNQKGSTVNEPDTSCAQHNGSAEIFSVKITSESETSALDTEKGTTLDSKSAESSKPIRSRNLTVTVELGVESTTTNNNDHPKGVIRVVSLEKLLDPKIASLQKLCSEKQAQTPELNSSVIILDSDDDNDHFGKINLENGKNTKKPTSKLESSTNVSTNSVGNVSTVKECLLKPAQIKDHLEASTHDSINTETVKECLPKPAKTKDQLEAQASTHESTNIAENAKTLKECLLKIIQTNKDLSNPTICANSGDTVNESLPKSKQKPIQDHLNSDISNRIKQYKLKRASVRIKSNKLIDMMIAKGKDIIKITPKLMRRIDSSVDEDLFKKLTSRDKSKQKREISLKKKTTERRTVDLSVSCPDDECNDDGMKESNRTKNKGIKIRIRRLSVNSSMSQIEDAGTGSNENEANSSSEDDNPISVNASSSESSDKRVTEQTPDNRKSNESESSDGEIVRKKPKRTIASSSSELEKNTKTDESTKKSKKRKRIKQASSDTSDSEKENANKTRKNIRKVLKTKDLGDITKRAAEEEAHRRKRIEERQKLYNQIYEQPETVELKDLVLDFDETTKEPILSVDPGILKKLKPHQAGGIKFMWDACFETIKDSKENSGSGCILAHCMGLGKTLQVVALLHTLMTNAEKTNVERALIITPLSTVTNWAKEFKMWMRFCKNKNVEIYDMSKWREKNIRINKTNEWFEDGGVCIMGYDMFRTLVNAKSVTMKKKQRDILQKCLIEPGPDIVICDEGHLLKNEKTSLSQAVNRITTKRRIVLTGTPLQNNLKEYYCMIQFIKPNLLGTYKEYLNRFVNPITNGQYTDSTERDTKLMRHRSHVLHKLLEGCIQRKDYSVLAPYLPPKYEYVVFITLSEIQKKLYKFYMTQQRDIIADSLQSGKGAMLFQDFQSLRRIWTHPLCLRMNSINVIRKKLEQELSESEGSLADFVVHGESTTSTESSTSESDDEEKPKSKTKTASKRRTRLNPDAAGNESEPDNIDPEVISDPSEWWKAFCQEDDLNNINNAPKLILLMEILQNCETLGDKVLLFSQSLQSLDVIEHFLSLIDSKTHGTEIEGNVGEFTGSWTPGFDYFRLDGSCSVEAREEMCKRFNDTNNLRGRLFLISTRAGSLGINLVAANRVIIFDVSWNPSYDTQSIFRVYRFGQTKPCYIYRFITLGTMEQKVYERQVIKQATAKRVVDEQQIGRHYNQSDLLELYKYEVEPVQPREVPPLPKDRLFADILAKHENLIYKYHDHNSLLENEESEILSEEERKAAWTEYQEEKERPQQQYAAYQRGAYNYTNGPVTSNKTFGFRNDVLLKLLNLMVKGDHPALTDEEAARLVPVYLHRFYNQMNENNSTMYLQLMQLCRHLEVPQGQYFPQPAPYQTQAPIVGLNQMSVMNMPQNSYTNPTPHSNQSQVYEID